MNTFPPLTKVSFQYNYAMLSWWVVDYFYKNFVIRAALFGMSYLLVCRLRWLFNALCSFSVNSCKPNLLGGWCIRIWNAGDNSLKNLFAVLGVMIMQLWRSACWFRALKMPLWRSWIMLMAIKQVMNQSWNIKLYVIVLARGRRNGINCHNKLWESSYIILLWFCSFDFLIKSCYLRWFFHVLRVFFSGL